MSQSETAGWSLNCAPDDFIPYRARTILASRPLKSSGNSNPATTLADLRLVPRGKHIECLSPRCWVYSKPQEWKQSKRCRLRQHLRRSFSLILCVLHRSEAILPSLSGQTWCQISCDMSVLHTQLAGLHRRWTQTPPWCFSFSFQWHPARGSPCSAINCKCLGHCLWQFNAILLQS